jgi:hypothetical protein
MKTYKRENHDGVSEGAETVDLEGFERESLFSLELVKEFETFETGSLFNVGRNFSSLSSGT